jgi:hypothetical protein
VTQPLDFAQFPPNDVWDAYIWFLFVPMIMRLILLLKPFLSVTKQLSPHGGWIFKRLKELPVRGFTLLALNEILAFFLPMLLVIIFRVIIDPLGWGSWDETNYFGLTWIILFAGIWIFFDFWRIIRVRRMLMAIEKQNIDRLKKVADAGLKARGLLRRFAKKEEPEKQDGVTKSVAKNSFKTWALMALKARKFTPAGLVSAVATGAAIEVARRGAGKVSDYIDEKMQEEFEKLTIANSKTLLWLFLRDLAMGIAPLVILWLIPLSYV